jgi:hypothetical protein
MAELRFDDRPPRLGTTAIRHPKQLLPLQQILTNSAELSAAGARVIVIDVWDLHEEKKLPLSPQPGENALRFNRMPI